MKFEELNIGTKILEALNKKGFEKVSNVQEKVIPEALWAGMSLEKARQARARLLRLQYRLLKK